MTLLNVGRCCLTNFAQHWQMLTDYFTQYWQMLTDYLTVYWLQFCNTDLRTQTGNSLLNIWFELLCTDLALIGFDIWLNKHTVVASFSICRKNYPIILSVHGEVSFKRPSARVLNTDHVRVVSPDVLEESLEYGLVLHFHVVLQDTQPHQHGLQVNPGQHTLHHISPVQAVNAVGSENSTLITKQSSNSRLVSKSYLSGQYTALPGLQEIAELLLVLGQPVQQDRQPVPPKQYVQFSNAKEQYR